eukprot:5559670-Prymnesium_polylepis.2
MRLRARVLAGGACSSIASRHRGTPSQGITIIGTIIHRKASPPSRVYYRSTCLSLSIARHHHHRASTIA